MCKITGGFTNMFFGTLLNSIRKQSNFSCPVQKNRYMIKNLTTDKITSIFKTVEFYVKMTMFGSQKNDRKKRPIAYLEAWGIYKSQ